MTKSEIATEMAQRSGTSIKAMIQALDALAEIAYRETQNGFVIPGICKLNAAKRKPRKFRHPISGEMFQIGERLAVTATPVKKCKLHAVPQQDNLITPVAESVEPDTATTQSTPSAPEPQPPHPPSGAAPQTDDPVSIVLECEHCGNTVASPAEYAGMLGQCPFCNNEITIPDASSAADKLQTESPPKEETPTKTDNEFTGFVVFVCHACSQEIEAPKSMIGAEASCPSCGSPVFVPAQDELPEKPAPEENTENDSTKTPDLSSMTIRIDLSDLA